MRKRAHVDLDRLNVALTSWMSDNHLTQADAAERIGISQAQISLWLQGTRTPSPASLARIADALGIDAASLAPDPAGVSLSAIDERIVMVPRDGSVGASGNGPASMLPLASDGYDADPYPAIQLQRLTGLDPSRLRSAIVVGDSIKKLVPPGTQVLYLPTPVIIDHGLYVIDIDGLRVTKIVQRLGGGSIALIPANKRYRTETFTPLEDADSENTYRSDLSGLSSVLTVVGKVVWYPTLA